MPQFQYDEKLLQDIAQQKLQNLNLINDEWLRNRVRHHNFKIQAAQCLLNHQDVALTQIWDEKYGPVDPQILKIAQDFAQDLIDGNGKFRNNKSILSDEIIDMLDKCRFDADQIQY